MRLDPPLKGPNAPAEPTRLAGGRGGVRSRALVVLTVSGCVLAASACHDGALRPKDSRFQIQLDVRSVPQKVSAVLDLVELTTRQGSSQQDDSLAWDAVVQGTPFTVELDKGGEVRFEAAALAGSTRPEGGVALLRGSTDAVVKDGFEVYVYLEDLTPTLVVSPEQPQTSCNSTLNLVMRRSATLKVCNRGAGVLTWAGGGGSVVGPQAESCPVGGGLCIALDPAGGQIPPGGEVMVHLRAIGDRSGVVPIEFEEIFEGLLLDTDTTLVTVEVPAMSLQIETDPANTDQPPGPSLEAGTGLTVSYALSNDGSIAFDDVLVTEEDTLPATEGVDTVFRLAGLEPGEVFDTTLIRPVHGGMQVRNTKARGTFDVGDAVGDSTAYYYVGLVPAVDLETLTNGVEDDTFPGPTVPVGSVVEIEYRIRNAGEVPLGQLTLTDTAGVVVPVTCAGGGSLPSTLAAADSVLCTLGMVAEPGQFRQEYTVTGATPAGQLVADADSSHYVTPQSPLEVRVQTNGVASGQPPGPSILVGRTVVWSYTVINYLSEAITDVIVTDSVQGEVCAVSSLAAGGTLVCQADGISGPGQYSSVVTVTGHTPLGTFKASSRTYYFGLDGARIRLQVLTRGVDAGAPPGPDIVVGGNVDWEYRVTNTGDVPLVNVSVRDGQLGAVCSSGGGTALSPGEVRTCYASGTATLGQYSALATAEGISPAGTVVRDTDPSYYRGVPNTVTDSVGIETSTNGQDADAPPGPTIEAGAPVTWSYLVTNRGSTSLTALVVTDDKLAQICARDFLEPGASFTCQAMGTAVSGQYENLGTVTALGAKGEVCDADPSHYLGYVQGGPSPGAVAGLVSTSEDPPDNPSCGATLSPGGL